jgi:predicted molibdopterin-dependent oxidoreductase YjgC
MGACQDCWVELTDGRRLRACTTLVEDGMAVVSQVRPKGDVA